MIKELSQEPLEVEATKLQKAYNKGFEDCRQAVCKIIDDIRDCVSVEGYWAFLERLKKLPPVNPQPKTGHCKDCKHFEYDCVEKVDGIPLIVAHEICSRWGDGCKTKEDGYCFLFEPQESEEA